MGGGGFEPPKRNAADLQSAPFGHLGTRPVFSNSQANPAVARLTSILITFQKVKLFGRESSGSKSGIQSDATRYRGIQGLDPTTRG
jgi:hypothetical protein